MDEYTEDMEEWPLSPSGPTRMPPDIQPIRPTGRSGTPSSPLFSGSRPVMGTGAGYNPTEHMQQALYHSVRSRPLFDALSGQVDDSTDLDGGRQDRPSNIYFMAQYLYQISISAVPMADHELGVLLPRSGRILFNARLFSEVPRGRELATRDVWWRVIDASPAVRFLLGWCVSLYRTAHFQGVSHEHLPGWSRVLYFSPAIPDTARKCVPLWSDVICDVTELFAPQARIRRQLKALMPILHPPTEMAAHVLGIRRTQSEQYKEDQIRYLADQNNCPSPLIQRSLDGNPPITSLAEYVAFTEAIVYDSPRLQMQRTIAMRNHAQLHQGAASSPLPEGDPRTGLSIMADPRLRVSFWQLHL
jgi:hypothetical protein